MKKIFEFLSRFNYAEKKTLWFLFLCSFALTATLIYQKNTSSQILFNPTIPIHDSVFSIFFNTQQTNSTQPLQVFDPNNAPIEELISYGLNPNIAKRFENYRKKFQIKNVDDLYKIYGIDSQWVSAIEPYLAIKSVPNRNLSTEKNQFPKNTTELYVSKKYEHSTKPNTIKINTATVWEWMDLKGIGAKTGERIIKYKENLGGFIDKNQLYEVWGIDSFVFSSQWDRIILDTIEIKRININTDSFKYLIKHPYIETKTAKLIMNYRLQHGDYKNIKDLYNIKVLPTEIIYKLSPYIRFD